MIVYTVKENDEWNRHHNRVMCVFSTEEAAKKEIKKLKKRYPEIKNHEIAKHIMDVSDTYPEIIAEDW